MSKWVVDIHGEIEGDYEIIKKYEEPKTGYWRIKDGKEQGYDISGMKTWYIQIVCSECGWIKTAIEGHTGQYHYCPNCGARMIEQVLAYADQDTLMPAT